MTSRPAPPILVRDALLVTQDPQRRVTRGDVRVEGGRFTHVGPGGPSEGAEVIDGRPFAIVPGFVNAHTHVAMSVLRGIADDRDLSGFLDVLFRVDARRTDADLEAGAAMGVAEMLLGGTTTFLDLYYGQDAIAKAVDKLGARALLGWAVLDPDKTTQKGDPVSNARAFMSRWKDHEKIEGLPAPQGVYVCNEETWLKAADLAVAERSILHCHLSETRREVHEHETKTGLRPPLWLEKIGAFRAPTVAAHTVWMTRREVETLAKHSVAVAHCPSSNLKLATGGIAPVTEMRAAGVTVGLGTDSAASNNTLSMLSEMRLAGLAQKHLRWDAAALRAQELLDLATIDGARAIGRGSDLGSIEVGKWADFSLFSLSHPSLQPARPEAIVGHLAYSASDEAVDSVFVGGEAVVRSRELTRVPWGSLQEAAASAADHLWADRGN